MPRGQTLRLSPPEMERRSQGTSSRTSSSGSRDPDGVAPIRSIEPRRSPAPASPIPASPVPASPVPSRGLPRIYRPDEEIPLPPEVQVNGDQDCSDPVSQSTLTVGINSMYSGAGPHQVQRTLHPPQALVRYYEQEQQQREQQPIQEATTAPFLSPMSEEEPCEVVAEATAWTDEGTVSALQVEAIVEESHEEVVYHS